jgi:hypothetical protein
MPMHRMRPTRRPRTSAPLALAVLLGCTTAFAQGGSPDRRESEPEQPTAQETDWPSVLDKALTHRRFAIRRAASNKLALGGADAVAAVREHFADRPVNEVPLLLVDAFASRLPDDDVGRAASLDLLADWATAPAFFFRARALEGLATLAPEDHAAVFAAGLDDPSWTYRAAAALGAALGDHASGAWRRVLDSDDDPRTRCELAADLIEHGDTTGMPWLLAALELEPLAFLDVAWGRAAATRARRALEAHTGREFDGDEAIRAWADENGFAAGRWPAFDPSLERGFDEGVEVRSCRSGDRFLRWNADGDLLVGLLPRPDAIRTGSLADIDRAGLTTRIDGGLHGTLVCDYLRVVLSTDAAEPFAYKAAAGALAPGVVSWLEGVDLVGEAPNALPRPVLDEFVAGDD